MTSINDISQISISFQFIHLVIYLLSIRRPISPTSFCEYLSGFDVNHCAYLLFQLPCRYCFLIEWENVFNTLKIWNSILWIERKYYQYQISFYISGWVTMPCEKKIRFVLLVNSEQNVFWFHWSLCALYVWLK